MMEWKYQFPDVVKPPAALRSGRWLLWSVIAALAGAALFLLHGTQPDTPLAQFDTWTVGAAPLLLWLGMFALRWLLQIAALGHYQDCQYLQYSLHHAWQSWAQKSLTVHAACVLLPDHVSASLLISDAVALPPRQGQARRIAQVPAREGDRLATSLELLRPALISALRALPVGQSLRVTLLSDAPDESGQALREAWAPVWTSIRGSMDRQEPDLASVLEWETLDTRLQEVNPAWELLVVLQLHGGEHYSDGLAVLLLSECNELQGQPSMIGSLCRPMPLQQEHAREELALFLQSQACARQATALLVDSTEWQASVQTLCALGREQGLEIQALRRWIQELLCGVPGPLSPWLISALALETAQHVQAPVLMLTRDGTQGWVNTVVPVRPI